MKPSIIPADLYTTAQQHLTPAELDTWKLHQAGYSHRKISRALNITRTTVRDRLDRAYTKLEHATRNEAA